MASIPAIKSPYEIKRDIDLNLRKTGLVTSASSITNVCNQSAVSGVQNATSVKVGFEKLWRDVEISEAFLKGDCCVSESRVCLFFPVWSSGVEIFGVHGYSLLNCATYRLRVKQDKVFWWVFRLVACIGAFGHFI